MKIYGIDYCGYKVATILRDKAFTQTAHQDVAFFDLPENNAGNFALQNLTLADKTSKARSHKVFKFSH